MQREEQGERRFRLQLMPDVRLEEMFVSYHGGWTKKCPSCKEELWSEDYPKMFKTHNPDKVWDCPKCGTKLQWRSSHIRAARIGFVTGAICGILLATYWVPTLKDTDSESVGETFVFWSTALAAVGVASIIFGIVATLANKLEVVHE